MSAAVPLRAPCSADELEPLVGEVAVEREGSEDPAAAHDREAHPIHEGDPPLTRRERRGKRLGMQVAVDPRRLHHGEEAIMQNGDGIQAQPALRERDRFEHHVVVRHEGVAVLE